MNVPELLLGSLPTRVRTRVWLALARIAQHPEWIPPARSGLHCVDGGYALSYRLDGTSRTVTLVGIEQSELDGVMALA